MKSFLEFATWYLMGAVLGLFVGAGLGHLVIMRHC